MTRVDEVFRVNGEDHDRFSINNDREGVSHLRGLARYSRAGLAGQMMGEQAPEVCLDRMKKDAAKPGIAGSPHPL